MLAKLVSKTRVVSARVARRSMATATEGEASGPHVYKKATKVKFNFNTPYEQVSHGEVDSVVLPGAAGVFTALPNSSATISELAPGVVRVKDGQTETKYFVSGGFAVINKDSSVAISAAEAINVDEIDVEAAKRIMAEAQGKMTSASSEQDKAVQRVKFETAQAIVRALAK